ncbi:MAG: flagellar filament capping protein FliD [Treponema sp.]|jgi:flagellar hook-associated protein 2|nr:flagellar filament capping protein FliD [Treponema sp.]
MSDIYVPGVKSRFNTEKLIDDLMKVERIPKERVEKNVENLETQKTYWQEIGRRVNSLRDSARLLFSFQNPFNDRIAGSSDESVITGTATREAAEQDYRFTVKQTAQADRFLSPPLDNSFTVEGGTYTFTVGQDEISFNFRGGSLKEFTEALNRRGRDKIGASLIAVERGAKSLLIESKVTGAENRLGFSGDAEKLAIRAGLVEPVYSSRRDISLDTRTVRINPAASGEASVEDNILRVRAGAAASIPLNPPLAYDAALVLRLETSTALLSDTERDIPAPPPGPSTPSAGSISYGGIVIENDPSQTPLPEWTPPEIPPRVDNLGLLSLSFSDGTTVSLPPIQDSSDFSTRQYRLEEVAAGKTITAINIENDNTHRNISLRNITILDPTAQGGVKARHAVSQAQDAVVSMEGIEIKRPSNSIDDLIPGVTLTVRGISERPVTLGIQPDREGVKNAIISLVGNYNRLMAEINVLTRNDDRIIEELSYLSADEQEAMRKRQGVFSGDSTLNQFKNTLQRTAASPYPTSQERDMALLTQIGVGTDVRRSGGGSYDPSRLRGYLEIDEKALDEAISAKLPAIQQLFGSDTNGDLIVDSGLAYMIDTLAKPFVESGGLVSLKTGTIDSRISQDKRRIDTMERQLAAKEAALKLQYGQMEGAYNRMERMATSLDQFSQQNSNNR